MNTDRNENTPSSPADRERQQRPKEAAWMVISGALRGLGDRLVHLLTDDLGN
ncbi:hypothetical protein U3653_23095 [Nocardia sp. CDC186]|uniref:Uncharacterized protein n=1 Tax=Nocardia implantans TaxID=3108168 RepID=A0ABU6AZJ1_9NOCA|nr:MULTISPECIES: hypothetical protein [unclassified Nocardia]MBF6191354.1 hypothetical protein [Nocardia beijingensis]MEA3532995.1 hypothetical protein [Nocardia sp. CDC192]MEB3512927.1 hypothetical protein [Nocardia sp. CDC186]